MLTIEGDVVVILWILNMQQCGLFITLQTQVEGGKIYLNLAYTISRWCTREFIMMVWVEVCAL